MKNWSENQVLFADEKNPCFQTVSRRAEHQQLIKVDPQAHYRLSARLKAVDGKKAKVWVALRLYDADKKVIKASEVTFLPNSLMVLAAPCKASDRVIRVKDASGVKLARNCSAFVAFGAKADLSDLPNRNLSKGVISGIVKKGSDWEINLKKPCGFSYPAGTAIRIHRTSAAFMYPVKQAVLKDGKWHTAAGRIYGKAPKGGAASSRFWNGTGYAQIVLIPDSSGMIYFDDLVFEKINKK